MLNVAYEDKEVGGRKRKAKEEELREATNACKQLFNRLKSWGIVIKPFHNEWANYLVSFDKVNERWEKLSDEQ